MTSFGLDPEDRPKARYLPDYELAYLSQRYTEIHDMVHVLTGVPSICLTSELLVKHFEMAHFGFPVFIIQSNPL